MTHSWPLCMRLGFRVGRESAEDRGHGQFPKTSMATRQLKNGWQGSVDFRF